MQSFRYVCGLIALKMSGAMHLCVQLSCRLVFIEGAQGGLLQGKTLYVLNFRYFLATCHHENGYLFVQYVNIFTSS